MGVRAGGAGGAFNAPVPVGEREGTGRATGDMLCGESKIDGSGVGPLKVCTVGGGGPGGGA